MRMASEYGYYWGRCLRDLLEDLHFEQSTRVWPHRCSMCEARILTSSAVTTYLGTTKLWFCDKICAKAWYGVNLSYCKGYIIEEDKLNKEIKDENN